MSKNSLIRVTVILTFALLLAAVSIKQTEVSAAETIKNQWVTENGKKYYYKADGEKATLSYKIKGVYYIFDKNGVLYHPKAKKVVTINKVKYQVYPSGKAAPGWNRQKTYYFGKNGRALTGVQMINEKFFRFNPSGSYNKFKTQKIRKAAREGKNMKTLASLIGNPKKKKYYSYSCYIPGAGVDAVWTYKTFKIYTFRYRKNKKEIFLSAEENE